MDELSNKRIEKNGVKGRIANEVSVTVCWDNGGVTRERLNSLKFLDIKEKKSKKQEGKYVKKECKES